MKQRTGAFSPSCFEQVHHHCSYYLMFRKLVEFFMCVCADVCHLVNSVIWNNVDGLQSFRSVLVHFTGVYKTNTSFVDISVICSQRIGSPFSLVDVLLYDVIVFSSRH